VAINAERQADEVMIKVSDNGIGIRPQDQEVIF
jgi:signal transduction histidine kinase